MPRNKGKFINEGLLVRKIRNEAKISQEAMGVTIGYECPSARSNFYNIEKGYHRLSAKGLKILVKEFNIDLQEMKRARLKDYELELDLLIKNINEGKNDSNKL